MNFLIKISISPGVGGDAAQVQDDVQRGRHRLRGAAQPHRLGVGVHGRALHEPQAVGRLGKHQVGIVGLLSLGCIYSHLMCVM